MGILRKKWPNRIISTNGFEVRIESRGSILYIESGRQLRVNSELLVDNSIVLYRSSLNVWSTTSGDKAIDNEKKIEIEENIKEALTFAGLSLNII